MLTLLLSCDMPYGCSSGRGVVGVFQPYVHYSLFLYKCVYTAAQLWHAVRLQPLFICVYVFLYVYFRHMWACSWVSVAILICACHLKLPALSAWELTACITTETVTTLWLTVRGQRPPLPEITSVKVWGGGLPKGPQAAPRAPENRPSRFCIVNLGCNVRLVSCLSVCTAVTLQVIMTCCAELPCSTTLR